MIFEGEYSNGIENGYGEYYKSNKITTATFKGEFLYGYIICGREYINNNLIFEGEYLNNYRRKGKEYINGKVKFEGEYIFERKFSGIEFDEYGRMMYEIKNYVIIYNGIIKEYYIIMVC